MKNLLITGIFLAGAVMSSAFAMAGCPDGSNGAGRGYGTMYRCGDSLCAKTSTDFATECVIDGLSFCPDGDNGPGKGYGEIYNCGDGQCAKTSTDYRSECVVVGS